MFVKAIFNSSYLPLAIFVKASVNAIKVRFDITYLLFDMTYLS